MECVSRPITSNIRCLLLITISAKTIDSKYYSHGKERASQSRLARGERLVPLLGMERLLNGNVNLLKNMK